MTLAWTHGAAFARLEINLTDMHAIVTCSGEGGGAADALTWQSSLEARA
jgi:hypothetical protein